MRQYNDKYLTDFLIVLLTNNFSDNFTFKTLKNHKITVFSGICKNSGQIKVGISKCNEKSEFNKTIGELIAVLKAMKWKYDWVYKYVNLDYLGTTLTVGDKTDLSRVFINDELLSTSVISDSDVSKITVNDSFINTAVNLNS